MSTAKDFTKAIQDAITSKTSAYDTTAEVMRVEGDTVWVHIPGGVDETPVKRTIDAKVGDTVQVRVGGGSAWLVGNASAPPTDDTTAVKATEIAVEASRSATDYVTDLKDGVFVHPNGDDTSGWKIADAIELLKHGVSYIWAGLLNGLATIRIGRTDSGHTNINSAGMRVYGANGTTELANIGYGPGTDGGGGTATSPYYTFGVRKTTTSAYSSSSTYSVGDMCVYDGKVYVCVHDITTPESWDANNWRYYIGNYSMTEGYNTTASGYASHAAGEKTTATGLYSHAEGYDTIASGQASHAEGNWTEASWTTSHAEGQQTKASGYSSHAEGYGSTASGRYSHAEGYNTTASGWYSHAEGSHTTAADFEAHAEGDGTTASGQVSHAEGIYTIASGGVSHAEGHTTIASENMAHAQNQGTIAAKVSQTALGTYNVEDTATGTTHPSTDYFYGQYAVIVGNGTDNTSRSNALTVDWQGNVEASGYVSGKRETVYDNASGWTPSTSTGTTVDGKIASYSQVEVHLSDGSFGICNLSWNSDGTGVILGMLSYPYNDYIYVNTINFKLTPNGSDYTLLVPAAVQMPANYRIGTSVLKVTTVRKLTKIIGLVATHE